MSGKEIEELLKEYEILEKAFDSIRLVDPVNKQVVDFNNKKIENTNLKCFDFWGQNKICDNCVSIRAYQDDRTYIKLEYSLNEIYVVTAIPINLPDRRVVIEILKNATNSLVLDSKEGNMFTELHELIDRMNNLALKDSLTNLYNRRYINEKLPIDLANSTMSGTNLSIIMADIDYFKKVNDTYGHLNGDRTLKQFAKILTSCIKRDTDWIARYGGEEFMICLPGANRNKAVEIAEKIRKKVEESTIDCGQYQFQITASFGVSTQTQEKVNTIEEMIDMADKKLYDAKNNGRNKVEA
jgi:diguanylate cyclase (GGDEF)-like protein